MTDKSEERRKFSSIIIDVLLELGYGPALLDGIDPKSLLELIREHGFAN